MTDTLKIEYVRCACGARLHIYGHDHVTRDGLYEYTLRVAPHECPLEPK